MAARLEEFEAQFQDRLRLEAVLEKRQAQVSSTRHPLAPSSPSLQRSASTSVFGVSRMQAYLKASADVVNGFGIDEVMVALNEATMLSAQAFRQALSDGDDSDCTSRKYTFRK